MSRINVAEAADINKLVVARLSADGGITDLVKLAARKLLGDDNYEPTGMERLFLVLDAVTHRLSEVSDVDDIEDRDTVVVSFDGSDVGASPPKHSGAEVIDQQAASGISVAAVSPTGVSTPGFSTSNVSKPTNVHPMFANIGGVSTSSPAASLASSSHSGTPARKWPLSGRFATMKIVGKGYALFWNRHQLSLMAFMRTSQKKVTALAPVPPAGRAASCPRRSCPRRPRCPHPSHPHPLAPAPAPPAALAARARATGRPSRSRPRRLPPTLLAANIPRTHTRTARVAGCPCCSRLYRRPPTPLAPAPSHAQLP